MKIGVLASIGATIDGFFPPLIGRWEELGHQVETAASTPAAHTGHSIIRAITRAPSLRNLLAPREIADWVRKQHIDVLVTNTATASFLARVARMPAPVVYFCHGLHWNDAAANSAKAWQFLERVALRNTNAAVVINDDDEAWFEKNAPALPLQRLSAGVGVPLDSFPRTSIPSRGEDEAVRLVWIGEFSKRKRPSLAIDVVRALRADGLNVHLTMCGQGPDLERFRSEVATLGLAGTVSLPGPQLDIQNFLASSHALLMTSAWEGLPRVGLEAIAIGRPVFAFDVKGTRSLPDVFLAPELDVDSLAKLIIKHAGSAFANVQFTDPNELHPNRVADEIVQFIERLLDRPRTQGN